MKKIKKTFLSVIACLVLVAPAFARLGDTEKDCEGRYGSASFPAQQKGVVYFTHGNFVFNTYFVNDKCLAEVFSKQIGMDTSMAWNDDDLKAVMDGDADGKTWTLVPSADANDPNKTWKRDDGAEAIYVSKSQPNLELGYPFVDSYDKGGICLVIISKEVVDEIAKTKKAANTF